MNCNRYKIFVTTSAGFILLCAMYLVCEASNSFVVRSVVAVTEIIIMFYLIFIWQD